VTEPVAPAPTGKGRPTPKRSAAERRRGPVAPPPKTRKEAAQRAREKAIAARSTIRDGAARGDARFLSKRDAGPVRKLVRDTVDGKRNIGVIILPLAVLLLLGNISGNRTFIAIITALWLASVVALLIDTVLTGVLIRRRVRGAFPEDGRIPAHVGYGLLRSTVFRRFRLPPPAVSPAPLPWSRRRG